MATQENGSEQQLESGKDVFFHPPSSKFLKRIMFDALEELDGKVSIGGRTITNLRFADDIDALPEEEQELYPYVDSLYTMYIAVGKHVLFCFPFVPNVSSVRRDSKVHDMNISSM